MATPTGRGGFFRRRRVVEAEDAPTVVTPAGPPPPAGAPPPPPPPLRPPPEREIWPWLLGLLILVLGLIAGYVIYEKTKSDRKSTPTVTVAAAKKTVPNVVGLPEAKADARLRSAGLSPRFASRASAKPRGTVFAETPGAGTQVAAGARVALLVSSGGAQSKVTVPNVLGLSSATAASKLSAAGLTSQATEIVAAKPAGTVVSQTPVAGDRVAQGTQVALKIAKGAQKVAVPDVVGQSSAAAQAKLRAAGLAATVVQVASAQPRGTVVAQSPQAGTQVAKGTNVRLNVARGPSGATTTATTAATTTAPATARVPNVVGLNQTAAQRRVQAAGLASSVVYVTSTRPAGRVVAQAPSPGTIVRRGSRVRLNVSTGPSPKPMKTVPDVTGQDEQTATQTLEQAGFVVESIDQATTDQSQDGIVLDEQPPGGSRAPAGSQVTIYVGRFSG
jgi:serine/threonine-protein kinase